MQFRHSRLTSCVVALAVSAAAMVTAQQPRPAPVPIASGFGAGAYSGKVVVPIVTDMPDPNYPEKASREGIEGEVLLDALVGPNGRVVDVQVTKPVHPLLDEQAVKAIRKWKFLPGKVDGRAVSVVVPVSVRFYTIRDGEKVLRGLTTSAALVPFGEDFPPEAVPLTTPGLVLPVAVREVKPRYTRDAMDRKIEGTVELEAVVGVDGYVTHARIVKSLDRGGLDVQALQAARQWTFKPCRLNDAPVACIITLDLEFRLH